MENKTFYVPQVGDIVRDTAKQLPGEVKGNLGGYYQLRPITGGTEWDVLPQDIKELPQMEILSLKAAAANHRSILRP